MKKYLILMLLCTAVCSAKAQNIQLPAADLKQQSSSVVSALRWRKSRRAYADSTLTPQEISNLCWAAFGVSYAQDHRTAPSAMNRQEVRLFVFTANGAYEYLAESEELRLVAKGDYRKLIAGAQDFAATAPVSLLMVIDFEKFGKDDQKALMMGCVDAGCISENINLYCEATGLATAPRWMWTDCARCSISPPNNYP